MIQPIVQYFLPHDWLQTVKMSECSVMVSADAEALAGNNAGLITFDVLSFCTAVQLALWGLTKGYNGWWQDPKNMALIVQASTKSKEDIDFEAAIEASPCHISESIGDTKSAGYAMFSSLSGPSVLLS